MASSAPLGLAKHSALSSYRENVIEHLFLGGLLRVLWPRRVEVMKPQVDDGGYDLALDCEGVVRHIRLKSSRRDATTARQEVHVRLASKPSGCVLWIQFDADSFDLGPFLWFGGAPNKRLPSLRGRRAAKGGARPAAKATIRIIPKGKFKRLDSFAEVATVLFGLLPP